MERRRKPPIPLLCTSSHPLDHTTLIPTATKTLLTGVLDGSALAMPERDEHGEEVTAVKSLPHKRLKWVHEVLRMAYVKGIEGANNGEEFWPEKELAKR